MGTGGAPCSFNQFLTFIEEKEDKTLYDVTSEEMPDVETTARALEAKGITTTYTAARIVSNVSEGNFASLFEIVGSYLSITLHSVDDDTIKTAIQTAVTGVARTRMAATMTKVTKALGDQGIPLVWRDVPVFDGASDTVELLDRAAIQRA
jgi:hypothetical protein